MFHSTDSDPEFLTAVYGGGKRRTKKFVEKRGQATQFLNSSDRSLSELILLNSGIA
jgi:hypothetical protein